MSTVITSNLWVIVLVLVIGLAAAWWMWGRAPRLDADRGADLDGDGKTGEIGETVSGGLGKIGGDADGATVDGAKAIDGEGDAGSTAKPNIKAAVGDPDNLALLKGVGPKLNVLLVSLGVTRFDQIAEWDANDVAEVDQYLGNFKGRVERDNWVDQARLLAAGDTTTFEAKYGALGSKL